MTRILVVDRHPVVRIGLQRILVDNIPDAAVALAEEGREALMQVRTGAWDVVLLDLDLPDPSGLEVLALVKGHRPELPVLSLSLHTERPHVIRALRAGTDGYITKDCSPEDLTEAVRKVAAGRGYLTSELAELLLKDPQSLAAPTRD